MSQVVGASQPTRKKVEFLVTLTEFERNIAEKLALRASLELEASAKINERAPRKGRESFSIGKNSYLSLKRASLTQFSEFYPNPKTARVLSSFLFWD